MFIRIINRLSINYNEITPCNGRDNDHLNKHDIAVLFSHSKICSMIGQQIVCGCSTAQRNIMRLYFFGFLTCLAVALFTNATTVEAARIIDFIEQEEWELSSESELLK